MRENKFFLRGNILPRENDSFSDTAVFREGNFFRESGFLWERFFEWERFAAVRFYKM